MKKVSITTGLALLTAIGLFASSDSAQDKPQAPPPWGGTLSARGERRRGADLVRSAFKISSGRHLARSHNGGDGWFHRGRFAFCYWYCWSPRR